jgi:thymidylate synthase
MLHLQAQDFSELYSAGLKTLLHSPEFETAPRGMRIREHTNVALVLENPLSCLYTNARRGSQKKYIAAELLWYFMGRDDASFISKYAKFWTKIQNEDGTVNSAYGNLIFTKKNRYGHSQYDWALQSLVKDKNTRQAVLHFNLPEHQYMTNKDFVCTMYAIFHIRQDRLNFTVSMRSNDVILGLPTDIAFFATLQCQMLSHLRSKWPNLQLGTYTHIANSLHLYEHHFGLVEEMLASPFEREEIPPVNKDLIYPEGRSSVDLRVAFDHIKDDHSNPDPLYLWIHKNINS